MISVFTDFETREKEVEGYFNFVLKLTESKLSLQNTQQGEPNLTSQEHEELLKTLKATCYLLLYNLEAIPKPV